VEVDMADLRIDDDREEVTDLVERYTGDQWGLIEGELERVSEEVKLTRLLLARLVDALADKNLLTRDELIKIIRGY
jgi:hypothetical protein